MKEFLKKFITALLVAIMVIPHFSINTSNADTVKYYNHTLKFDKDGAYTDGNSGSALWYNRTSVETYNNNDTEELKRNSLFKWKTAPSSGTVLGNNGIYTPVHVIYSGTKENPVYEYAAFCVQQTVGSPYNKEVKNNNWPSDYTQSVQNGLKAIIECGYPGSTNSFNSSTFSQIAETGTDGGTYTINGHSYNAEEARQITANAIRIFLKSKNAGSMNDLMTLSNVEVNNLYLRRNGDESQSATVRANAYTDLQYLVNKGNQGYNGNYTPYPAESFNVSDIEMTLNTTTNVYTGTATVTYSGGAISIDNSHTSLPNGATVNLNTSTGVVTITVPAASLTKTTQITIGFTFKSAKARVTTLKYFAAGDKQDLIGVKLATTTLNKTISVTITPEPGIVILEKESADTSITGWDTGHNYYDLNGAKYQIQKSNGNGGWTNVCVAETGKTTNARNGNTSTNVVQYGQARVINLEPGTYQYYEISASTGFTSTTAKNTFTIVSGQTTTVSGTAPLQEPPKLGNLTIYKGPENVNIPGTSLAGAQYEIHHSSLSDLELYKIVYNQPNATGEHHVILTTDDDGRGYRGRLPYGQYTIQEIVPSPGYQLSHSIGTFTIDANTSAVTLRYNTEGVLKEPSNHVLVSVVKSAATNNFGTGSFAGARYTLYSDLGDGTIHAENEVGYFVLGANGNAVEAYKKENGSYVKNPTPYLSIRAKETDSSGNAIWEGNYILKETQAPTSGQYDLNQEEFFFHVNEAVWNSSTNSYDYSWAKRINNNGTWSLGTSKSISNQSFQITANDTTALSDSPNMGNLEIYKIDAIDNGSVQGAIYEILKASDNSVVGTMTATDASGKSVYKGLLPGSYLLREKTAPDGYKANTGTYAFTITAKQTTKLYGGTGTNGTYTFYDVTILKDYPDKGRITIEKVNATPEYTDASLQGAEYTLYNASTNQIVSMNGNPMTIGADGTASLVGIPYGTYYLVETAAPTSGQYQTHGSTHSQTFTINENNLSLKFTGSSSPSTGWTHMDILADSSNRGSVEIYKVNYYDKNVPVPGAVYAIYKNSSCTGSYYAVFSATDNQGKATLVSLPTGNYWLRELSSPSGYEFNTAIQPFTITANTTTRLYGKTGTNSGSTTYDVSALQDKSLGATITIHKSSTYPTANNNVDGAVYGLFSSASANVQTDTPIYTFPAILNGTSTLSGVQAGTYYLKEISAPEGFYLNNGSYQIVVTAATTTVDLTSSQTPILSDTPNCGKLVIHKVDNANGNGLGGAVFEVRQLNTIFGTITTDSNGNAELNGLPAGTYTLKEIVAPDGYQLATGTITFAIHLPEDNYTNTMMKNGVTIQEANGVTTISGMVGSPSPLSDKEAAGSGTLLIRKYATSDTPSSMSVDGAVYTVTNMTTGATTTLTISNGTATTTLAVGEYYLQETTPPTGFKANSGTYTFTITKNQTTILSGRQSDSDATYTDILMDEMLNGGVVLIKKTTSADSTYLSEHPLTGAVYGIKQGNTLVATITICNGLSAAMQAAGITSSDFDTSTYQRLSMTYGNEYVGLSKLPAGTYTLYEITPPSGYLARTNEYEFTVEEDGLIEISKTNTSALNDAPDITGTGSSAVWIHKIGQYSTTVGGGEIMSIGDSSSIMSAGNSASTNATHSHAEIITPNAGNNNNSYVSLNGCVYELFIVTNGAEVSCGQRTTANGGIAGWENLEAGSYVLREISVPSGWTVAAHSKSFTLEAGEEKWLCGWLKPINGGSGIGTYSLSDGQNATINGLDGVLPTPFSHEHPEPCEYGVQALLNVKPQAQTTTSYHMYVVKTTDSTDDWYTNNSSYDLSGAVYELYYCGQASVRCDRLGNISATPTLQSFPANVRAKYENRTGDFVAGTEIAKATGGSGSNKWTTYYGSFTLTDDDFDSTLFVVSGTGSIRYKTIGLYYIIETSPASGFNVNNGIKQVILTDKPTIATWNGDPSYLNPGGGIVTPGGGAVALLDDYVYQNEDPFIDSPIVDKQPLIIKKVDADTGLPIPQGNASLAGARFRVNYYKTLEDSLSGLTPDKTWILETDTNGEIKLDSSHFVSGDSFYTITENNETIPVLPLGTITVQETVPPEGYKSNTTVYTAKITSQVSGSESVIIPYTLTVEDEVIKGGFTLQKYTADRGPNNEISVSQAQSNAVEEAGAVFKLTKDSPDGQIIATLTTDQYGYIDYEGMLPYGDYYLTQTNGTAGYMLLSEPLHIVIDQDGRLYEYEEYNYKRYYSIEIAKKDTETGQIIACAGTQFKLKVGNASSTTWYNNGAVYTTGADGKVTIQGLSAGTYTIVEITAPTGYSIGSPKTITVSDSASTNEGTVYVDYNNQKLWGNIYISKRGKAFNGTTTVTQNGYSVKQPVYTTGYTSMLAGAVFDIYANEDIKFGNTIVYNNGDYVGRTDPTDGNGEVIYWGLPAGEYRIVEVTSPSGYVISSSANITVEIDEDDDEPTVTINNDPKPLHAVLQKMVQVASLSQSGGYQYSYQNAGAGFIYGLYTSSAITENGKTLAKNTLVATAVSDANGLLTFDGTFPRGQYYLKELAVPSGSNYSVNSTTTYPVSNVDVINSSPTIVVNARTANDDLIKKQIQIRKVDSTTNSVIAVAGVTFDIKTSSGQFIERVTTDSTGIATLSSMLPVGTYKVQEVLAPAGYYLDTTEQTITITSSTASPYTVTMSDAPIKGTLSVLKQGKRLTGTQVVDGVSVPTYAVQPLPGATFKLYAAENIVVNGSTKHQANDLIATVTTANGTGIASFTNLWLGNYYLIEYTSPTGYVKDSSPIYVSVTTDDSSQQVVTINETVSNTYQGTSISLVKYAETVSGGEVSLVPGSGFVFGLYTRNAITENGVTIPANTLVAKATSDANGNVSFSGDFPQGNYYVKEISTITGWNLNTTEYNVQIVAGDEYTPVIDVFAGECTNEIHNVTLQIVKKDSVSNAIVKLAGTVFEVYDAEDNLLYTLTTDATGTVTVPERMFNGTYTIVETQAPYGYTLNTTRVSVTIDNNTSSPLVVEISNDPLRKGLNLKKVGQKLTGTTTMTKNGQTITVPTYTYVGLQGVSFRLTAEEDIYVGGVRKYAAGATVKSSTTSNSNGNLTFSNLYPGKYRITELTNLDDYYSTTSQYWIYTIKIATAEDAATYNVAEGSLITLDEFGNLYTNTSGSRIQLQNYFMQTRITLEKEAEQLDGSYVPGVGFGFGLFAAEDIVVDGNTIIPAGTLIDVEESDAEQGAGGGVEFLDIYPYGSYYVQELYAPAGYIIDDTHYPVSTTTHSNTDAILLHPIGTVQNEIYRNASKIVKVDTNNQPIRVAGIQFTIRTPGGSLVETVTTNANGEAPITAILESGVNYTITETAAPTGYMNPTGSFTVNLNDLTPVSDGNGGTIYEIKIQNTPIKGQITVNKTGSQPTSVSTVTDSNNQTIKQINYTTRGLEGATIGLYQAGASGASTDITYNSTTYHLVLSQVTNASGTATFSNLELGTYLLKEIAAPAGYLLNTSWAQVVTLSEGNKTSALVTATASLTNTAIKTHLDFIKREQDMTLVTSGDTITPTYSFNPAGEFLFGLYNRDAIVVNGTTIPANSLLASAYSSSTSGNIGHVVFDVYLPQGNYYVKEIETKEGYLLDTTEYNFTNTTGTPSGSTLTIPINSSNPIDNYLLRGAYKITKKSGSSSGALLAGAGFQIIDENNVVVAQGLTNASGVFGPVTLPNGTYTVHEYIVPDGHIAVADWTITIEGTTSTVQTTTITKVDTKTRVNIGKTNGLGGANYLPGATMQIKLGDTVIEEWVSTDTYKIIYNLLVNTTYTIHEVSAPEGYGVNTDVTFWIDEQNKVHYKGTYEDQSGTITTVYKFRNYKAATMPVTGSEEALTLTYVGAAIVLLGLAFGIICIKKKRRKTEV